MLLANFSYIKNSWFKSLDASECRGDWHHVSRANFRARERGAKVSTLTALSDEAAIHDITELADLGLELVASGAVKLFVF